MLSLKGGGLYMNRNAMQENEGLHLSLYSPHASIYFTQIFL